jgi:hypothetical protein
MIDEKNKIIDLLIEKNKIMTRIAELSEKKGLYGMTKKQSLEHKKLINRNSDILEELTKLGYAEEIVGRIKSLIHLEKNAKKHSVG